MLKNGYGAIKYFLVLLFLVVVPIKAWGGSYTIPDTDFPEDQLYFFWDLRDRQSFFQVTNTASAALTVHVQVFNAATGCTEFDYLDTYTGNDTHLYDVSDLDRNNLVPLGAPVLTGGFGFVAVSILTVSLDDEVLIGNFRVIDDEGYEYRVNAAGNFEGGHTTSEYTFNFNDIDSTILSDVVGIPVRLNTDDDDDVEAGLGITTKFNPVTLFDDAENPISCPPVTFACAPTTFDLGINQFIVNSKGENSICLGTDTNGYVDLLLEPLVGDADFFVGFIGLNNGDGTGSMDVWWAIPEL